MRTLLEEKAGFAIVFMARMLEVSTQGYYAWLDREASPRDLRSVSLKEAIRKIHTDSEGVYGTPRILEELGKAGWVVSRKTVAKSTKESGIAGISPRSYVTTTVRDGSDSYPADLVKRRWDRDRSTGSGSPISSATRRCKTVPWWKDTACRSSQRAA